VPAAALDGDAAPVPAGKVVLIQAASNRGYAAGNNIGIKAALKARAEHVLILNNDVIVQPGYLETLVRFMQDHGSCGIAGPVLFNERGQRDPNCARRRPESVADYLFRSALGRSLFPDNKWVRHHFYLDDYSFQEPRAVDIISGSCMLIRRDVFERIGLLDEHTFLYLEEFILHEKLRSTSYYTAIVPLSTAIHKGGRSIANVDSVALNRYSKASFRYYLRRYRRFHPVSIELILLASSLPILLRATAGRFSRFRRRF
jgi:GT2 family glycosyltransferase